MNTERAGMYASFRTLRAERLGAVILERCREDYGAPARRAAPAAGKQGKEVAAR